MSGYRTAHEVDQYFVGRDAVGFLMKEAFALAVICGFAFGTVGAGILAFIAVVAFFAVVSRVPALSGAFAIGAGIFWGVALLQLSYAFGAGDFTAWTIGIVAGFAACSIHNRAFLHNRIVTE